MTAYVLSRKEFEWRNQFSFFFYFTTLFSGGLVPYYVLMTQTLNLRDSYLALLLPAAVQRIQPSDHEELHRGTSGFSD